ncbi:MAG: hypothetical protein K0Q59_4070 [Paenibacillus sp.]|jgi:cytoskeletal protein CcmA (bactofilin family)|nr:hypothetical protein [Paenibacillus sp.]
MATPALHDLKLVGTTSSAGGQYGTIKITGECSMSSDVTAESLACVGEIDIRGALRVKRLKLTGECAVSGHLEAERIRGVGMIGVSSIRAGDVKLSGHISVAHNCEAESLHLLGLLEAGDLVSAEHLHLRLYGLCRVRELGGGTIDVKRSRLLRLKNLLSTGDAGTLTAELIEGDTVHLEHVTADLVRGGKVTIGIGCRIGRVEYRESLERHGKAEIGSESRV